MHCSNMVTFYANCVFTEVVHSRLGKLESKHTCFHSCAPLLTIHNKNGKNNIKIHNNAKIQDYEHTKLFWPCDASLK